MTAIPEFNLGYDPDDMQFILWRQGKVAPVALIPFGDALRIASTVCHVAAERAAESLSLHHPRGVA